jgi:hypothetical protein
MNSPDDGSIFGKGRIKGCNTVGLIVMKHLFIAACTAAA